MGPQQAGGRDTEKILESFAPLFKLRRDVVKWKSNFFYKLQNRAAFDKLGDCTNMNLQKILRFLI